MNEPPPDCQLCERLCKSRRAVVYGDGPQPCSVLLVAQAPGRQEEMANPPRPLIGWSGKRVQYLATEIAGFDWATVRRTNVTLCRPPTGKGGDLPPKPAEIANCRPYLLSDITASNPQLIIPLGAVATKWFFPKAGFSSIRGKVSEWTHPDTGQVYKVAPQYHPAAAAPGRNPGLYKTMEEEWAGLAKRPQKGEYYQVTGKEATILFHAHFMQPFAFDLETKDNHWPPNEVEGFTDKDRTFQAIRSKIIGWSFCFEEGTAYYCTDDIGVIAAALKTPDWPKCVHNALFEVTVLASIGIYLRGYDDTKLMATLLGKTSSSLKDLSATELGIRQTLFKEVDWDDIEMVVQYGGADADCTFRLWRLLAPQMREGRLMSVYRLIDLPVIQPITECQRDGFLLDQVGINTVRDRVHTERREVLATLEVACQDSDINWGSPKQVGEWLYGDASTGWWEIVSQLKTRTHIKWHPPGLGLPVPGWTETGQAKVDINSLHSLDHPLAEALVKLSSADQFLSSHSRTFQFLAQEDGRVHPSYHISGHWETDDKDKAGAPITGRLSSTGPNAQQITNFGDDSRPYVHEWGQDLRRCIVPAPGYAFLEADFAQQEPRIGAMVSGDTYMDHLLQTADVYRPAAADLYHVALSEVDKDMRQIGKRAWMAWLNRAGPAGIQRSAWWLSREEAVEWLDVQDSQYHVFTLWALEQWEFVRDHLYVETWFGRRVYIPQAASRTEVDQQAAYRAAIPGIIQGTGADCFKFCLSHASPYLRDRGCKVPLLIHDAIVVETPEDKVDEVALFLKGMSEGLMPSPLPIEVMVGHNWSKRDMEVI